MTARRPAPRLPEIDLDRCTGCGRCVAACEPRVLSLETQPNWRKAAMLHGRDDCTGCSLCAVRCPFDAIKMRAPAMPDTCEPLSDPAASPTPPSPRPAGCR